MAANYSIPRMLQFEFAKVYQKVLQMKEYTQLIYEERMTLKRRQLLCLLDKDKKLRDFVLTKLQYHFWTPEQIAGWLKYRQKKLKSISHETIYTWLYKPLQKKEKLWKFFYHGTKLKEGLERARALD